MSTHAVQITALEPSWATRYSEQELRGLVVLAALFNQRVDVHDTQLVDHTILLSSFVQRGRSNLSLFGLVHDLVREGIINLSLRESVTFRRSGRQKSIESFVHLHEALSKRSDFGWVTADQFDHRKTMLAELESAASGKPIKRYDYKSLKKQFMEFVQESGNSTSTEHYRIISGLDTSFRKAYDALISRNWFSFIDIIDLCAQYGYRQDSLVIYSHGLFDEMCYAEWSKARMLGSNSKHWFTEHDVAPLANEPAVLSPHESGSLAPHAFEKFLKDQALAHIDIPGLALLGSLTAVDIMELREQGQNYWQLSELQITNLEELSRRSTEAIVSYWDHIAAYIRRHRPALATDHTRLAVFLRRNFPRITAKLAAAVTVTIDFAFHAAGAFTPGSLNDELRTKLRDALSLKFLFYRASREYRSLKAIMPTDTWLLAHHRHINKGDS